MLELAKIVGALAWFVGLLLLALAWIVGLLLLFTGSAGGGIWVLLIALTLTIVSRSETRKRREEKLVATTSAAADE